MSLAPGNKLGVYEVVAIIGRGAMGEVYRARDSRLDRDVALKTLPDPFAFEPDRIRRFQREAKILASLNHPNIATIYGLEDAGGVATLVLELVEGPTLADRIAQGAIPLEEALPIARQIAQALEAAHDQGIIHRDLKPANIKLRADGIVKVLDFGLAKAFRDDGAEFDRSQSPTVTADTTREGLILGTPGYMSPEQARGQVIDKRTDIWAFGCVLYEMLTGRAPFTRKTIFDTLAAVLDSDPDWNALSPAIPLPVHELIRRCLERDTMLRLRDVGEARITLDDAVMSSNGRGERTRIAAPSRRLSGDRWRQAIVVSAIGIAAVALGAILMWWGPFVAQPRAPTVRSLAVLPLKPLDGDHRENYLGLSVADSIIVGMSRVSQITVRPTSAVRRYATDVTDAIEAGKALGVDAVLDGAWQREGERLRVSVNLLNVSNGGSLWAERFDVRATEIFALQDEVSEQLVGRLQLQLNRDRPVRRRSGSPNPDAYDLFAKGQFYFAERGFTANQRQNSDNAIELFQRAVALDPSFAQAHAQLGYAYAWTAVFIEDDPTLIDRAEEETRVACSLDPSLGQVHLTRAFIAWSKYRGWRIDEAIREQRMAEQLEPGLPDLELAALYVHLGFFDEYRTRARLAIDRDPTNLQMKFTHVNEYFLVNLPEEGLAAQQLLLKEGPDQRYFLAMRQPEKAAPIVEKNAAEMPDSAAALAELALLRALQGKHAEAQEIVPRVLALVQKNRSYHHFTYTIARVYALGGMAAEAAKWLDETVQWGFPCYPMFAQDDFLDPVRESPELRVVLTNLKARWDRYREELR